MSKAKAKGTAAENLVLQVIRRLFPFAERRALTGAKDKGDIAGTPLVWEVKSGVRICLAEWLRETEAERQNAGADFGVLVIKLRGMGEKSADQFPVLLPLGQFMALLAEAGYGNDSKYWSTVKQAPPTPGG